jgi:hypothetical protein
MNQRSGDPLASVFVVEGWTPALIINSLALPRFAVLPEFQVSIFANTAGLCAENVFNMFNVSV